MKRRPELRGLSEDHHLALALARRCEVAARGQDPKALKHEWEEATRSFATLIEPHFRIEEHLLVPALEQIGEAGMARRILDEHVALRRAMTSEPRDAEHLHAFADLLGRHVRYEEREVFEGTQGRLPPDALARLEAASEGEAPHPYECALDVRRHLEAQEAIASLPEHAAQRFREVFRHGTLQVEIYAPRGRDEQTPHTRDEVYVVIRGRGMYTSDAGRTPFGPGDFLFAPAGVEHRFEDFSNDLAVWVLFYGPEGGEGCR
jgi:mannose-6-phosphate isomerase-like protein (cupin superfamily)